MLARTSTRWVLLAGSLGLVFLRYAALGRFTDWDEAVFFSQSGDFEGAGAPLLPLAASREGGTPGLIWLFRQVGMELAEVRMMLLLLVLGLGVFAFVRLGRHFERASGETGFLVFGLFWTTLVFSTGLYGSLIWACVTVLFLATYLDLVGDPPAWRIRHAIGFGVVIAAMFWMRSLESVIVVGIVGLHSLLWKKALIWRRMPWSMVAAGVTYGLVYVLPWAVWSTIRWGSVAARIEAVTGQISRAAGTELNGLAVYWDALVGGIPANGLYGIKPTWVWPIVATFLIAGVMVIGASLVVARGRTRTNLLAVVTPLIGLIVFFSIIYTDAFRDRYLSGVVPIYSAALGGGVAVVANRLRGRWLRPAAMSAGLLLFGVWAVAQFAIATDYRYAQIEHGYVTERTIDAVRALAGDQPCVGVARYGRAQIQLGSGCRTYSAASIDSAMERLAQYDESEYLRFLVWPNRDLEDTPGIDEQGWTAIDFSTDWRTSILYILDAGCPDGSSGLQNWGTGFDPDCSSE